MVLPSRSLTDLSGTFVLTDDVKPITINPMSLRLCVNHLKFFIIIKMSSGTITQVTSEINPDCDLPHSKKKVNSPFHRLKKKHKFFHIL